MAEEAMRLMTDEEISAGGLGTALRNAKVRYFWIFDWSILIIFYDQGNYSLMVAAVILGAIRGMELPALSLLFGYVFEVSILKSIWDEGHNCRELRLTFLVSIFINVSQAFTFTPWGADMMHRLCMAVICFGSVGVGTMIFQLSSVRAIFRSRPIIFKLTTYRTLSSNSIIFMTIKNRIQIVNNNKCSVDMCLARLREPPTQVPSHVLPLHPLPGNRYRLSEYGNFPLRTPHTLTIPVTRQASWLRDWQRTHRIWPLWVLLFISWRIKCANLIIHLLNSVLR